MYNLLISEQAKHQISKASQWFLEQQINLDKKFLLDLDKSMCFIQKNPLKCQVKYRTVRIEFLKKFDFGIHFIIENNTVFVLNVIHTSQNSDNWF